MSLKDKITGASASTVAKSGGAVVAVGSLATVSGVGTAALAAATIGAIAAIAPKNEDKGK